MMRQLFVTIVLGGVLFVVDGSVCAIGEGQHDEWNSILQTHVKNGRVNYQGIKADTQLLDRYLRKISAIDPATLSRPGKLALWINAYNAFTVKLIVNNHPIESIKDIKSPWEQKIWLVGGKTYSLDDIEHTILRKELKEPRIHFSIVCASLGCPDLWNQAFTEDGLENQLNQAALSFARSPKNVRIETVSKFFGGKQSILYVSKILKWFEEDFTDGGKRTVPEFISLYADKRTAEFIRKAGKSIKVKYIDYDWSINEQK